MKEVNQRLKTEMTVAQQALKQIEQELKLNELKKVHIVNRKQDVEENIRQIKELAEAMGSTL